ncbi:acyl carrier protein [Micromonospora sp. WMMC241]|uniref:acyl carrier protein n=1 Tax=Micromonospora sp. WMMC241 TaxID=3015159 RepID=UPI0022B66242|nr:acyl carrier protein [Micromonospora sp. WMMC241]MCZ7437001.1 acyl carrier protein [Micromonospora sp. WMMC241]
MSHARNAPDPPTTDPVWTPILTGLRATALDCLQTSFALLADHAHGSGSHLALGARYGFRTRERDGLVTVEATSDDRAAEAVDLLGLRVEGRWMQLDGPQVRRLCGPGQPLYVTADAYDLPWCPYHGHERMRHSFLVTDAVGGEVTVVDGYHNDTAWGAARPGVWRLPTADFDAALAGGAHTLAVAAHPAPAIDVPAMLAGNAERAHRSRPEIADYLARIGAALGTVAGLHRFVLDVWLLGRARDLHEQWLATARPGAAAALAGHGPRWQALSARSYVALRRAQAGRPATPELADALGALIAEHLDALESIAAPTGPEGADAAPAGGDGVRAAVLGALGDTLHLDGSALHTTDVLRELPGFDSFRLVDVIDRVERRLGVEVPATALSAADLRDVGSLCAMFGAAAGGVR